MVRSASDPTELRPIVGTATAVYNRRNYDHSQYKNQWLAMGQESHAMMTGRSINELVTDRVDRADRVSRRTLNQNDLPWLPQVQRSKLPPGKDPMRDQNPMRRSASNWRDQASSSGQSWAHKTSLGFHKF